MEEELNEDYQQWFPQFVESYSWATSDNIIQKGNTFKFNYRIEDFKSDTVAASISKFIKDLFAYVAHTKFRLKIRIGIYLFTKNNKKYDFRYFYPSENTKIHDGILIGNINTIESTIKDKCKFDEELIRENC